MKIKRIFCLFGKHESTLLEKFMDQKAFWEKSIFICKRCRKVLYFGFMRPGDFKTVKVKLVEVEEED